MKGNVNLTIDLCRIRAIAAISNAIRAIERHNLIDAFMSYGEAMTYEFIYDSSQSDIEINSLFRDSDKYRALVVEWSNALNEVNTLVSNTVANSELFTDRDFTKQDL